MVRTKEFEPDAVLSLAGQAFKRHGYHAISMETLTEEMGIGRGSLYATFGDKRALFIAALQSYAEDIVAAVVRNVENAAEPVPAIRALLEEIAAFAAKPEGRLGCLLTNTATEFGSCDPEIRQTLAAGFTRIEDTYYRALTRAQRDGALGADKKPRALARLLLSTMQGLRVIGKTNPDPRMLRDIADAAMLALE